MGCLQHTTLLVLALCVCCENARGDDSQFVVAGYIPDYRMAAWSKTIGPLTDLILFGMPAPTNGHFDAAAIPQQHLAIARQVKDKSNCRLLFTVGGWDKSQGFATLAADAQLRKQFIHDAREFCTRNGFAGIDYDWEHPEGAKQIASFAELLKQTQTEFARHKLIVTIAQAGWQDFGRATYESVDRVHLMSYDHEFPQATFAKSLADVERLIKAGCPRGKIVLGLPFYGRNKDGAAKTYAELASTAALYGDVSIVDGFAFNGPKIIAQKVRYAQQQQLGGVMIWELGQDAAGTQSLLQAVSDGLSR
jgi:GH18 family chitinase